MIFILVIVKGYSILQLLDDLEYNRNVAILFVNNGQVNERFKEWNVDRYLNYNYTSSTDEDYDEEEDMDEDM